MRLFLSSMLFASVLSAATPNTVDTVRTRLCDYWKYDFKTNSYACTLLGYPVDLVEAPKQDVTARLEARIAELEKKVEQLVDAGVSARR